MVNLEQSSGAAIATAIPLVEKKRKSHKAGERSSSKRNSCEGSVPRPLLGSVFSLAFNASHKTNFDMNSTERVVVEPLSEAEVTMLCWSY